MNRATWAWAKVSQPRDKIATVSGIDPKESAGQKQKGLDAGLPNQQSIVTEYTIVLSKWKETTQLAKPLLDFGRRPSIKTCQSQAQPRREDI